MIDNFTGLSGLMDEFGEQGIQSAEGLSALQN